MKLKLPLKKNRQIPFLAFLSQAKLLMAFAFFMFLQTGFAQVTITPWKINKGGGAINYSLSSHGNPVAYSQMNIPNISDANWTPAPVNSNGEINFSTRSILSRCLQQLDFTYFETFINIPASFNVSNLNVSFTAADDGARAYIFNSSHPNGAFIGEIRLGQTAITANYASLTVAGESNRLVIVQFDDCPTGNNLRGAKVNVNGQTVAINNGGCTTSNFFWSNPPTVNGTTATGTINGIAYTYTSSVNVRTTSNVFQHYRFPASFNVPNNNPTIQNIEPSANTLTFASPMTNPVLVFSSIGGGPISVPINFSAPVEVLWSTHVGSGSSFVQNSPTQITGQEAFAIVRMNGTFSSISFDYLTYENYVNFVFGADFITTTPDTMAPTVTLNGSATQAINAGTPYTDPGATVADNCDTSPTLMVSGSVDVNVPGTYTLSYNAVDASGNVSPQVTRTVTVQDVTSPTVVTQDITVNLDASGQAVITPQQIDNGSSDSSGPVTLSLDAGQGNFTCANVGPNTVTLVGTDASGNFATATAQVTVVDAIAPTVAVQNINVDLDVNGLGSIVPSQIDAGSTDNCGVQSITVSPNTFDCTNVGANTVTLTVTDVHGNVSTGTATVTVRDLVPPVVVTQNVTVTLDANGLGSITAQQIDNGSHDACGIDPASFSLSGPRRGQTIDPANITCADLGTHSVTFSVADVHGNVSSTSVTITVVDTTAPTVITKPITVQLDASGNATITPQQIDNGSSDNCGSVTLSLDAGQGNFTCSNVGPNTVTLVGTDASGNFATATAQVTVVDAIAPTVAVQNINVDLDVNGLGSIVASQIDAGSSDNCGVQSITVLPNTFDCTNVGANTVILTVTDVHGNVSTGTATVTVRDLIAPVVVTQNATVTLDANGLGSITAQQIDNGSHDACGIDQTSFSLSGPRRGQTIDPANITCADLGTHSVTFSVADVHGNVSSTSVTITVVDTTAPVIATLADINITATSAQGAVVNYTAPVGTDNCTPTTTMTAGLASGEPFPIGTTVVTYTVTDASGNTASSSFNVVVVGVAPVIISPGDITQNTDAGQCGALVSYAATETVGIPASTITYTIAPGSNFTLGTTAVTATATNAIGSSSTTFNVIVQDVTAPTVITQSMTVQLDANGAATITAQQIDNGSFDNCSVTLSLDVTSFSCENVGSNTVTLTGVDPSGNTTSTTAVVTVEDNISPTAITQAFTTTITGGVATVTAQDVDGGSYDNCGIQSMSVSPSTFVCGDQGNHTVTLTLTDNSGNTSTATAIVTVLGDVPTISVNTFTAVPTQNTNTVYLGYGPQSVALNTTTTGGTGFTYSWTSSTGEIVASVANPTITPLVSTTYTVTVTNANGCDATTSIDVCVIDARAIDEDGEYDGEVLVCKGGESDDDDDDNHHGPKTKEVEQEDVREYLEEGGILGGCNATCSTVYVEVVADNDDNDHGDDDHSDNDDDDHADNDDNHNGDNNSGSDDSKNQSDDSNKTKVIIYPNPVEDEAEVALNIKKKGEGEVKVYDYKGRKVFSKKVKNLKRGVKVNMRGKETGNYYVRIKYKGKTYTATLFKKR